MTFKKRKYLLTNESWDLITLIQVIPCFNFGWIRNLMDGQRRFNVSIGWMFWILEWSWEKAE